MVLLSELDPSPKCFLSAPAAAVSDITLNNSRYLVDDAAAEDRVSRPKTNVCHPHTERREMVC